MADVRERGGEKLTSNKPPLGGDEGVITTSEFISTLYDVNLHFLTRSSLFKTTAPYYQIA